MEGCEKCATGEKNPLAGKVLRACAWVACGAALVLVPALGERALDVLRWPEWADMIPSFTHFLWTTAIPFGFVVAALANALSERLAPHRRAVCAAAVVALLAYLGVCAVWFTGDIDLVQMVRWAKAPLRYLAWGLWGACLPLWVLRAPEAAPAAPTSPLSGVAGAERLTEREREVAELLVTGCTLAQAAEALGISASSAGTYRTRACEKLALSSLDELVPLEAGAPANPRPFDVGTPAAGAILVMALCAGLIARIPLGSSSSAGSWGAEMLIVLALLLGPWAALVMVARFRDLRVRPRAVTGRLGLVLLVLFVFGVLAGGRYGLHVYLGSFMVAAGLVAAPVYVACVARLAPYLLWPEAREATELDEERCVLYLRGRGAGELQARVLTEIAIGRTAPEICEGLHVARGTVNAYRAQGYELLGVHTSRELAELLARDVGRIPSAGKKRPSAESTETDV